MGELPSVADRQYIVANNLRLADGRFSWCANVCALEVHEHHVHGWDIVDTKQYLRPALFIGGAQSTRLTEPQYRDRVSLHFPRARVEMVADAGHFVHYSHGAVCARAIAEFIARDVLVDL